MKDKKIEKVLAKVGGGISYEMYDKDDNIIAVIHGIEYQTQPPNIVEDIKGLITGSWDYTDASDWYNNETNSTGGMHVTDNNDGTVTRDRELLAVDVIDDHDSTRIVAIATADGVEVLEPEWI